MKEIRTFIELLLLLQIAEHYERCCEENIKKTKNGLYRFVGILYQYILYLMFYGFTSCLLVYGLLYCFGGYAYFRAGECDGMERGS